VTGPEYCLRPFAPVDATSLMVLLSAPEVQQALTFGRGNWRIEYRDALRIIEEALTDSARYVFAIEVRKELAGGIAFEPLQTTCSSSAVSTSYWLSSHYWGRGIMAAALSEAMCHLFYQTPVTLIEARTSIHNRRSRRVLEKCGFAEESSFSRATTPSGLRTVELVFRARKENFKGSQIQERFDSALRRTTRATSSVIPDAQAIAAPPVASFFG
jgi:RimJ/RimL family protein N-acetyltransferase